MVYEREFPWIETVIGVTLGLVGGFTLDRFVVHKVFPSAGLPTPSLEPGGAMPGRVAPGVGSKAASLASLQQQMAQAYNEIRSIYPGAWPEQPVLREGQGQIDGEWNPEKASIYLTLLWLEDRLWEIDRGFHWAVDGTRNEPWDNRFAAFAQLRINYLRSEARRWREGHTARIMTQMQMDKWDECAKVFFELSPDGQGQVLLNFTHESVFSRREAQPIRDFLTNNHVTTPAALADALRRGVPPFRARDVFCRLVGPGYTAAIMKQMPAHGLPVPHLDIGSSAALYSPFAHDD